MSEMNKDTYKIDINDTMPLGIILKTGEGRTSNLDARREGVLNRLSNSADKLLQNNRISDISLNSILSDADVSRATFYKLFYDIPHFYQFMADRYHVILRGYQIKGYSLESATGWKMRISALAFQTARFYHDYPVTMRLWLALDSPVNIRIVDYSYDEALAIWILKNHKDEDCYKKLHNTGRGVEILLSAFKLHDAILSLGFEREGIHLGESWFREADLAQKNYLSIYLPSDERT